MVFKKKYTHNHLSLKKTTVNHIEELIKYSLNKKLYKYLEYFPFKKEEAKNYFKKKIIDKNIFFFTIFFKREIIGTFSINNYDNKKKECLIGYGINPKFWGKGIFSHLIKIVQKKIFTAKGQKINVITRYDNFSSIVPLIKKNFLIIKKINNFYFDKKTKKKYDAFKLQWIKK